MKAEFAGDQTAPAGARSFVAAQLAHLSEPDAPATDDLVLIVSELVTNAVRAGARTIEVRINTGVNQLDLQVTDDAEGWPAPRDAGPDEQGGRGLSIVAQLADSWRTTHNGQGKTVTASWFLG